jgi:hypothetical protein
MPRQLRRSGLLLPEPMSFPVRDPPLRERHEDFPSASTRTLARMLAPPSAAHYLQTTQTEQRIPRTLVERQLPHTIRERAPTKPGLANDKSEDKSEDVSLPDGPEIRFVLTFF